MNVLSIILSVVGVVAKAVTPELRQMLTGDITKWSNQATRSGNEFDIALVNLVKGLLGM